ncbi:unnamed protein product [Lampetra fluviatilis]
MAKRPEARAAAGVPVVGARRVLKCEWALAVAEPPNVVGGQPLPPVVGALDWGSSGCVFGVRHNRHTRAARTRRENRRRGTGVATKWCRQPNWEAGCEACETVSRLAKRHSRVSSELAVPSP